MKNLEHNENPQTGVEKALEDLKKIVRILKNVGLNVIDRNLSTKVISSPTADAGFPICSDGIDGIRASYSKSKGLRIWFTNGFESPDNEVRQKVTKLLNEAGFDVK